MLKQFEIRMKVKKEKEEKEKQDQIIKLIAFLWALGIYRYIYFD